MARIGLILACDHYPAVSANVAELDAQLRLWLRAIDVRVDSIEVYAAYDGALPRHGAGADVWIVSGRSFDEAGEAALERFLKAAASLGRTILAVNHGEHVLHEALAEAGAVPPTTAPYVRAIRNPFRSFQGRDTLYRFNPALRAIEALERPEGICPKGLFGYFRAAA